MESPFTGKEMTVVYERRTWSFRGDKYEYNHAAWRCEDSGECFTTDEMDDASFAQVTNQYRAKYGIPFCDEIIAVRHRYDLSAAKMSLILGIGTNQWRCYEAGEVPSVSNGRMIKSIMNPKVFLGYVNSSRNILGEKEFDKLSARISALIENTNNQAISEYAHLRVFQNNRGVENGFAPQSLQRLKNILIYIMERCGEVFCTKMNKLLFYADYLSYRRTGMAMTGLTYKAIDFGPVPERWDRVYSQFDDIQQEPRMLGDREGNVLTSTTAVEQNVLTTTEIAILDEVCSKFAHCTSSDMTRISHEESLWADYIDGHKRIPFDAAYKLKAI